LRSSCSYGNLEKAKVKVRVKQFKPKVKRVYEFDSAHSLEPPEPATRRGEAPDLVRRAEGEKKILGKLYDLFWEACDLSLKDAVFLSLERYGEIIRELRAQEPGLVSDLHRRVKGETEWLEQKIELGFEASYEGIREDIKRLGKLLLQLDALEGKGLPREGGFYGGL